MYLAGFKSGSQYAMQNWNCMVTLILNFHRTRKNEFLFSIKYFIYVTGLLNCQLLRTFSVLFYRIFLK